MKIAIHGLGRMGMQLTHKLLKDGHEVIGHNRSPEPIDEAAGFGAIPAKTKQDVLQAFGKSRVIIWSMLPADVTASQLKEWLEVLPDDAILIDGANSDFRHTKELASFINKHEKNVTFLDVGVSGGVWGLKRGFCMMVGGDESAYHHLKTVFDSLAAPGGIHNHFGANGSGHYVKMAHNAIEYGIMESLAEGYRLLREGEYPDIDLVKAGDTWQHGSVITSWLNELTRDALRDNPTLEGIDGYVAENGEARWALEDAKSRDIPMPAIRAAMDVRLASQIGDTNFSTKLLAAMRNKFGGHALNK